MTITLFIVSMFALCLLFAIKVFEIKVRKIDSLSSLFVKGDEIIHSFIDKITFTYNRYKKISHIFVFEFLPSYVYELLVRMKDYVSKKYYMMAADGFRGRRVLRSTGSVSFFLERLSESGTDSSTKI